MPIIACSNLLPHPAVFTAIIIRRNLPLTEVRKLAFNVLILSCGVGPAGFGLSFFFVIVVPVLKYPINSDVRLSVKWRISAAVGFYSLLWYR